MNEVATLISEWEAEILHLETTLWQLQRLATRPVPKREQRRLEVRLRVARQSQRLLYGLVPLVA